MIIASRERASPSSRRPIPAERLALALAALATIAGALAAWWYFTAGLTLSHYDARAHLVVARRIADSLTPGWRQIGAVWLPLPHVLNALPVQIDAFYRTGLSGVLISVASFGLVAYSLVALVARATGSRAAAAAGCATLVLNPNLLYLQATPMTEPLLIGLLFFATAQVYEWASQPHAGNRRRAGWGMALACLTRYEAWPVCMLLLAASLYARVRRGERGAVALSSVGGLAAYPALAILGFLALSRATVGEWFVTGGFFVPDNQAAGRPLLSLVQVWWGTHELSGYGLTIVSLLSVGLVLGLSLRRPALAPLAIALAPLGSAVLPWYAFLQGHPFRIRYMVPVVAAGALCSGLAAGLSRWRRAVVLILAVLAGVELAPLNPQAPMVLEAQWDSIHSRGRRQVTDCLRAQYRGEAILMSMGSLAHYMQELSAAGFELREFLHEGNGDLWTSALADPRPIAGWILVEEEAEGGDALAARGRSCPEFFEGFARVCEGGGVALYGRRLALGTQAAVNILTVGSHAK